MKTLTRSCLVDECKGSHKARGYCKKHYARYLRYGDASITKKPGNGSNKGLLCKFGDDNKVYAKGVCQKHYDALRNGWDGALTAQLCVTCDSPISPFRADGRLVLRQQFYCSDPCKKRHGYGITIQELVDRDGTDCSLCGKHIELNLVYPDPLSRSIDHIIPRSRGGSDEGSNLALAHLVCNYRKHNNV